MALKAVVGEEALSPEDHLYLEFLVKFEESFLSQGSNENREIHDSLDMAWNLLRTFPREMLKKIPTNIKEKYYHRDFDIKNK